MKLFVFAVDCLELNLVEKWRLETFKQEYFGLHDVSLGEALYTPLIWASFLTGEDPKSLGFTLNSIKKKRVRALYGPILHSLYLLRSKLLPRRRLGFTSLLIKLGFIDIEKARKACAEAEQLPEELKEKTIVRELAKKGLRVWVENFPAYNERGERLLTSVLLDKPLKERVAALERIYEGSRELFEEALGAAKELDAIFYYTPLLDVASHLLWRRDGGRKLALRMRLLDYYKRVERMLIKLRVSFEGSILVVSDHGFDLRRIEHSGRGFWSLNVEPPLKPERITDFYKLIRALTDVV